MSHQITASQTRPLAGREAPRQVRRRERGAGERRRELLSSASSRWGSLMGSNVSINRKG